MATKARKTRTNDIEKLVNIIKSQHGRVETLSSQVLDCALAAGDALLSAKSIIEPRKWTAWVEENLNFKLRTAQDYMHLAKHRSKLDEWRKTRATAFLTLAEALLFLRKQGPQSGTNGTLIEDKGTAVSRKRTAKNAKSENVAPNEEEEEETETGEEMGDEQEVPDEESAADHNDKGVKKPHQVKRQVASSDDELFRLVFGRHPNRGDRKSMQGLDEDESITSGMAKIQDSLTRAVGKMLAISHRSTVKLPDGDMRSFVTVRFLRAVLTASFPSEST